MLKPILLIVPALSISTLTHAQWATSAHADSALCLTPGFEPGLLTFDNGSSIISGTLENDIYLMKLDGAGNRIWPNYVLAHHNDSTKSGSSGLVNDGEGGSFLAWGDHRGATQDQYGYVNEAIYMQHVDSSGRILLQAGGVQVAPAYTGRKAGDEVSDGSGGIVFLVIDSDFYHAGATNTTRLWATRYDGQGKRVWEVDIDSGTTPDAFIRFGAVRFGNFAYWTIMRYGAYMTLILGVDDPSIQRPYWANDGLNVSWKDSILFRLNITGSISMLKIGINGDTLWNRPLTLPDGCIGGANVRTELLIPTNDGGTYFVYLCGDTLFKFDSVGNYRQLALNGIGGIARYVFWDGGDGIIAVNDSLQAQRWDGNGVPLWGSYFHLLEDPGNAYFKVFGGDNRGGVMTAFWTVSGCIRVQHSGRFGKLGIVTDVPQTRSVPMEYTLLQNYPNPFNPTTTIRYSLARRSNVKLTLFDFLGRKLRNLVDIEQEPGEHEVTWDCTGFSSGIYYYRLQAGPFTQTRALMVIK